MEAHCARTKGPLGIEGGPLRMGRGSLGSPLPWGGGPEDEWAGGPGHVGSGARPAGVSTSLWPGPPRGLHSRDQLNTSRSCLNPRGTASPGRTQGPSSVMWPSHTPSPLLSGRPWPPRVLAGAHSSWHRCSGLLGPSLRLPAGVPRTASVGSQRAPVCQALLRKP